MQIHTKTSFGSVLGVGNIVSNHGFFAGYFANLCHNAAFNLIFSSVALYIDYNGKAS